MCYSGPPVVSDPVCDVSVDTVGTNLGKESGMWDLVKGLAGVEVADFVALIKQGGQGVKVFQEVGKT